MASKAEDLYWLNHCLALAKQGWYSTAPNPRVGAVIVNQGVLVGEGAHLQAGEPHAEVFALRQAGQQAKGATAYVSLEPCSHYGRTPPCSLALIQAGVARVVIGMQDPNPLVAGKGMAMLREAGIEVIGPLLPQEAEVLNPGFCKRMRNGLPWVRLKMAASLDGRTAMADGESQWITSPEARLDVQYGRAQSGAVLSTAKTVMADDAALNVRPEGLQPLASGKSYLQPLRVILDARLEIPQQARLWQQPGPILWVYAGQQSLPAWAQQLGVQGLSLAYDSAQGFDLLALLRFLAERQVNELWVEAGATLAASLVKQALVDEYWLYLAPKLLGADARPLLAMNFPSLAASKALTLKSCQVIGSDLRLILGEI